MKKCYSKFFYFFIVLVGLISLGFSIFLIYDYNNSKMNSNDYLRISKKVYHSFEFEDNDVDIDYYFNKYDNNKINVDEINVLNVYELFFDSNEFYIQKDVKVSYSDGENIYDIDLSKINHNASHYYFSDGDSIICENDKLLYQIYNSDIKYDLIYDSYLVSNEIDSLKISCIYKNNEFKYYEVYYKKDRYIIDSNLNTLNIYYKFCYKLDDGDLIEYDYSTKNITHTFKNNSKLIKYYDDIKIDGNSYDYEYIDSNNESYYLEYVFDNTFINKKTNELIRIDDFSSGEFKSGNGYYYIGDKLVTSRYYMLKEITSISLAFKLSFVFTILALLSIILLFIISNKVNKLYKKGLSFKKLINISFLFVLFMTLSIVFNCIAFISKYLLNSLDMTPLCIEFGVFVGVIFGVILLISSTRPNRILAKNNNKNLQIQKEQQLFHIELENKENIEKIYEKSSSEGSIKAVSEEKVKEYKTDKNGFVIITVMYALLIILSIISFTGKKVLFDNEYLNKVAAGWLIAFSASYGLYVFLVSPFKINKKISIIGSIISIVAMLLLDIIPFALINKYDILKYTTEASMFNKFKDNTIMILTIFVSEIGISLCYLLSKVRINPNKKNKEKVEATNDKASNKLLTLLINLFLCIFNLSLGLLRIKEKNVNLYAIIIVPLFSILCVVLAEIMMFIFVIFVVGFIIMILLRTIEMGQSPEKIYKIDDLILTKDETTYINGTSYYRYKDSNGEYWIQDLNDEYIFYREDDFK